MTNRHYYYYYYYYPITVLRLRCW